MSKLSKIQYSLCTRTSIFTPAAAPKTPWRHYPHKGGLFWFLLNQSLAFPNLLVSLIPNFFFVNFECSVVQNEKKPAPTL